MDDNSNSDLSMPREVNSRKDQTFKIRCESAKSSTGLHSADFYRKAGISRQAWYFYSWGLQPFPLWLKIKLCDLYGKAFRDLFLTLGGL